MLDILYDYQKVLCGWISCIGTCYARWTRNITEFDRNVFVGLE